MSSQKGGKWSQDIKGGFETTAHITTRTPAEIYDAKRVVQAWSLKQPDPADACREVLDMLGLLGDHEPVPVTSFTGVIKRRKPRDAPWPISTKHGTLAGLRAHEVRDQPPCGPCRNAGVRRDEAAREVTS